MTGGIPTGGNDMDEDLLSDPETFWKSIMRAVNSWPQVEDETLELPDQEPIV